MNTMDILIKRVERIVERLREMKELPGDHWEQALEAMVTAVEEMLSDRGGN